MRCLHPSDLDYHCAIKTHRPNYDFTVIIIAGDHNVEVRSPYDAANVIIPFFKL